MRAAEDAREEESCERQHKSGRSREDKKGEWRIGEQERCRREKELHCLETKDKEVGVDDVKCFRRFS